jgi:hypothetical protein
MKVELPELKLAKTGRSTPHKLKIYLESLDKPSQFPLSNLFDDGIQDDEAWMNP